MSEVEVVDLVFNVGPGNAQSLQSEGDSDVEDPLQFPVSATAGVGCNAPFPQS